MRPMRVARTSRTFRAGLYIRTFLYDIAMASYHDIAIERGRLSKAPRFRIILEICSLALPVGLQPPTHMVVRPVHFCILILSFYYDFVNSSDLYLNKPSLAYINNHAIFNLYFFLPVFYQLIIYSHCSLFNKTPGFAFAWSQLYFK